MCNSMIMTNTTLCFACFNYIAGSEGFRSVSRRYLNMYERVCIPSVLGSLPIAFTSTPFLSIDTFLKCKGIANQMKSISNFISNIIIVKYGQEFKRYYVFV